MDRRPDRRHEPALRRCARATAGSLNCKPALNQSSKLIVDKSQPIAGFNSKALAELWEKGRTAKIDVKMHLRIFRRLDRLGTVTVPEEMNIPGFDFHALRGVKPKRHSVHVNGPWCIAFEFEEGEACRVDFDQYHQGEMVMARVTKRDPDRCPTHPGALLREDVIPATGKTKAEIAQLLGISRQHLYDVLRERKPVSPAVAVRLGRLFGDGAGVWVRMQGLTIRGTPNAKRM